MAISLKRLAFFLFLAIPARAGEIIVNNFGGGLDTLDSPAAIASNFAQDLLNVNFQPGGSAVFKRDGYGLFQSLGSGQGVHGGYHFQQLGGSNVQIWASSSSLYSSVNDGSFVAIATSSFGATWQCTDSQGQAYCFSSSNDTPIQTDGTSANTVYFSSAPSGSMATFTPLQLVVAGVAGNANTIYISAQNAFNNFTPGILPSSPFTEPIASPGSRLTHLAYYFGRLFWWKDQSFGYATFTGQNDWQLTIVSNQIGTLDNSDAFWNSSGFDAGTMFSGTQQANAYSSPGGIFFRGQDNHIYVYDGYYLTRLSRIITPTVTASNTKKANAWSQNSQGAFNNGSISPAGYLSTAISPGSVVLSTMVAFSTSDFNWNAGTLVNLDSTTNSPNLQLAKTNCCGGSQFIDQSYTIQNTSFFGYFGQGDLGQQFTSGPYPNQQINAIAILCGVNGSPPIFTFSINADNGNTPGTTLASGTLAPSSCGGVFSPAWNTVAITTLTISQNTKYWIYTNPPAGSNNSNYITWNTNTSGAYGLAWSSGATTGGTLDFKEYISTQATLQISGSFTSQSFNIGQTTHAWNWGWGLLTSSQTNNGQSILYQTQVSTSSTGPWSSPVSVSSGSIGSSPNYQFIQYVASFTSTNTNQTPILGSVTINTSAFERSTGTFYSAVNNAPNLTSWGTFGIQDVTPGNSQINFYTRSSTNSFTVLSSTPAWVSQPVNSVVQASTGTYMQAEAVFSVTAATEVPALSGITFNWYEGSASDKAYMTYFNDAIWFAVSSSSNSSTNNHVFYWDLLNGAWSYYDIKANGFLVENNTLYFGDPTTGSVYKYGGVPTDNGNSINSYWRSKSFLYNESENSSNGQTVNFPAVDDLFVQKQFTQADFILGESSTTLNYTYTVDSKTSTIFTMTAYDSSASLIQRNFLLPIGVIGKYYDFKVGDNSSNAPWKMIAHRVTYDPLSWKPVLK